MTYHCSRCENRPTGRQVCQVIILALRSSSLEASKLASGMFQMRFPRYWKGVSKRARVNLTLHRVAHCDASQTSRTRHLASPYLPLTSRFDCYLAGSYYQRAFPRLYRSSLCFEERRLITFGYLYIFPGFIFLPPNIVSATHHGIPHACAFVFNVTHQPRRPTNS